MNADSPLRALSMPIGIECNVLRALSCPVCLLQRMAADLRPPSAIWCPALFASLACPSAVEFAIQNDWHRKRVCAGAGARAGWLRVGPWDVVRAPRARCWPAAPTQFSWQPPSPRRRPCGPPQKFLIFGKSGWIGEWRGQRRRAGGCCCRLPKGEVAQAPPALPLCRRPGGRAPESAGRPVRVWHRAPGGPRRRAGGH